jgi:hypothetical protein
MRGLALVLTAILVAGCMHSTVILSRHCTEVHATAVRPVP